jgi:hypothetical protein
VDATIKRIEEALATVGDRAKPHLSLGVLYLRKQDPGRAERAFQEACRAGAEVGRGAFPPRNPLLRQAGQRAGRARVQDSGRPRADRLARAAEACRFLSFRPEAGRRQAHPDRDDPEGAGLSARLASPRTDRASRAQVRREPQNLTGPSQEEPVRPGGAVPAGARTPGQEQHQ